MLHRAEANFTLVRGPGASHAPSRCFADPPPPRRPFAARSGRQIVHTMSLVSARPPRGAGCASLNQRRARGPKRSTAAPASRFLRPAQVGAYYDAVVLSARNAFLPEMLRETPGFTITEIAANWNHPNTAGHYYLAELIVRHLRRDLLLESKYVRGGGGA